ncbi:MAG: hypothetical protein ACTSU2_03790 [Promethearchaeota archaeon]
MVRKGKKGQKRVKIVVMNEVYEGIIILFSIQCLFGRRFESIIIRSFVQMFILSFQTP